MHELRFDDPPSCFDVRGADPPFVRPCVSRRIGGQVSATPADSAASRRSSSPLCSRGVPTNAIVNAPSGIAVGAGATRT